MHISINRILGVLLFSSVGNAFSAPLATEAAKSVLNQYLSAEANSEDLFTFCKATRPLVQAADYPDCPPHGGLVLIRNAEIKKCDETSSKDVSCSVEYLVVGESGPLDDLRPVHILSRKEVVEILLTNTSTGYKVSDPYLLPHVHVQSAAAHLNSELANAKSQKLPNTAIRSIVQSLKTLTVILEGGTN